MLRRFAVALAGLALLTPHASAAVAGPSHAGTITLTGTTTGFAWLSVTKPATYDVRAATVDYAGGRWGGFALGRDTARAFSIFDLRLPTLYGDSFTRGYLRPGRYKLRLFTDGQPVTVKLPWSGPDITLSPTDPVTATVAGDQVPVAAADPSSGATGLAFPINGRVGDMHNIMVRHFAAVGIVVNLAACITRDRDECGDETSLSRLRAPGTGMALNSRGVVLSHGNFAHSTRGMWARGEVAGTTAGVLAVFVLHYQP